MGTLYETCPLRVARAGMVLKASVPCSEWVSTQCLCPNPIDLTPRPADSPSDSRTAARRRIVASMD